MSLFSELGGKMEDAGGDFTLGSNPAVQILLHF